MRILVFAIFFFIGLAWNNLDQLEVSILICLVFISACLADPVD